ncbi:MAG: HD domain-containing phosphohydrolase [Planctomycetota bacterium]
MKYQIRKRHILILAIASAQAICLCWGVFIFNSWLRTSVRQVVHDQVLADNVQTAEQMINLIRHMEVGDLRENKDSWLKLQSTVREIRLPNEGFVCVTDAGDGELLCHPLLRKAPKSLLGNLAEGSKLNVDSKPAMDKPAMAKPQVMAKPQIVKPEMDKPQIAKREMVKPVVEMAKPAIIKPSMVKAEMAKPVMANKNPTKPMMAKQQPTPGKTNVRGFLTGEGDHLEIVAAGYVPELDANVNVHQRAVGVERKIAGILQPIVPIGLVVSLSLVIGTTLLICEILRRYENRLARINENLEHLVDERTKALKDTRDAVIFGLAKLAESRDTDTGEHLERIRIYVTILAKHLSRHCAWIDNRYIENLGLASSLHDIGKVAIPDQILLKPGRFEPDERAIMETHAERGGKCLQAISERLGENDFLELSREIAFAHHEKWDGSGYPFQVSGDRIPFAARIVALADVYDALRSRRPYKDPMPHEKAKQIIMEGDGSHFDPLLVRAFLACEEEFLTVSDKYAKQPAELPPIAIQAADPVMAEA